jgi:N-acyl-L-homoserine lactone synthetase
MQKACEATGSQSPYASDEIVLERCRRRPSVALLSGEQIFESFAMRFQVYCQDRKFLDAANYPDGLESDDFDWVSSTHIGVYGVSGKMIGTVRLVRPSDLGLPMDAHCSYDPPARTPVGEISRLAVTRQPSGVAGDERYSLGEVSLQLYHGLYQVARARAMPDLLTAMEPSLERLARRLFIPWVPIGPLVDYYGMVRPYLLDLDELDRRLEARAPEIREVFHTPIDGADATGDGTSAGQHRH